MSKIDFKVQNFLIFIPFFNFPVILIIGLYNVFKQKGLLYSIIYFLLCVIPFFIFSGIGWYIIKRFIIDNFENIEIVFSIFVCVLISYIIPIFSTLISLIIQKAMLKK